MNDRISRITFLQLESHEGDGMVHVMLHIDMITDWDTADKISGLFRSQEDVIVVPEKATYDVFRKFIT